MEADVPSTVGVPETILSDTSLAPLIKAIPVDLLLDLGTPPQAELRASDTQDHPSHAPVHARAASSIPTPFDTTVGDNFTTSGCRTWFNSFIKTNEVLSCVPISLLLQVCCRPRAMPMPSSTALPLVADVSPAQTSTSFFRAAKSVVTLTSTLDTSCAVNYNNCAGVMDQYATQLQLKANCMQDYQNSNPIVLQAYQGLVAYKPVYRAACLKSKVQDTNGSANAYCMAQAFTNRSAPANSYTYYLPLGNDLPGGAVPTCTRCLSDTMQGYAAFAGNATQPLSQTYAGAVSTVDLNCGPKFVNATIPIVSAAIGLGPSSLALTLPLALALLFAALPAI